MAQDNESVILKEGYFIVLALILAFGILQFSGTVLGTDRPVVSVVSCSMYPEYDRGDVLGVKGADFEDLQEDDVVVFQVPFQAELEINDERFNISGETSNTPLGTVKVISVQNNQALLEVDGDHLQVQDGGSYTVSGQQMIVRDISGMQTPIVHRIISKDKNSVATKGDNNPEQLEFEKDIRPENIHGRVFFIIPKIGMVKLAPMDFMGMTPPEQREVGFSCG